MKKIYHRFFFFVFSKILNFLNFAENSPQKLLFQQKMLSRSQFSSNHFAFRKISVSPAFSEFFLSSPSGVFYRSEKSSLEKNLIRKIVSLKKKTFFYLLLIVIPFFWEQKLFSTFHLSFYFFAFVFFCFFFFFYSVFLVSFIFFWVFQTKKSFSKKQSSFEKCVGFSKVFFWTFFEEGTYFWSKKRCSKIEFWMFFKKSHLKKEKNLFQDSHALRIACAIESHLDHCCVSWRGWASQVYVHSVVIDLGRGTSVASGRLSLCFLS